MKTLSFVLHPACGETGTCGFSRVQKQLWSFFKFSVRFRGVRPDGRLFKSGLYCDSAQISPQMLHGHSADVFNVLIKSATAAHVFLLAAPACGKVLIQCAASLVSHMS